MIKSITLLSAIVLTGCTDFGNRFMYPSYTPQTRPVYPPLPEWERLIDGSDIKVNINKITTDHYMELDNGFNLSETLWDNYLKDYIESFPLEKRDDILQGIVRHHISYDKVEKFIRFSNKYTTKSYVSVTGTLTKSKADALLEFRYYGKSWLFANNITIVADDFKLSLSKLDFYRDHKTTVWEYAYLDLSDPKHLEIARKIASSNEAIIRFHGSQYYSDLEVTRLMKEKLSMMLNTMDIINKKE